LSLRDEKICEFSAVPPSYLLTRQRPSPKLLVIFLNLWTGQSIKNAKGTEKQKCPTQMALTLNEKVKSCWSCKILRVEV